MAVDVKNEFIKSLNKLGINGIILTDQDKENAGDIDTILSVKVNIRPLQKNSRADSKPNENIHWVEALNSMGKKGWLYGPSNYIAFETNDYWVLVEKNKLAEFIASKVQDPNITNNSSLFYKKFRLDGRKDILVKVKTIDLCYIAEKMIKK